MREFLTSPIKLPLGTSVLDVKSRLAKHLGLAENCLQKVVLNKQSVDARNKQDVHFVCSFVVQCSKTPRKNATPYVAPLDILAGNFNKVDGSCIVVGAGPAGLFLARYLTSCGAKVTVIERGSDAEKRVQKVKTFADGGEFDENCNVQFGLGGAGTFSDGKLTTGISSSLVSTVFNEFVRCGAPSEILTSSLPHVGTDKLVGVVSQMRDEIVAKGGRFLFDTTVTGLIMDAGKVRGVEVTNGSQSFSLTADCVALCCGHSARNLFHEVVKQGAEVAFKPFAVGLRVEHTRQFINQTQYGPLFATHRDLGAASYKLVNNVDGRGCYSFCMCPGGVVVPANSERETVVVNGMSNFARDAQNSNSALVVSVSADDVERYGFGRNALSGVRFQQSLEKQAYCLGGGNYVAPCQNVADFLQGKVSTKPDVAPSYSRGTKFCDFSDLLPQDVCNVLKTSLVQFNKKMKGFAECGILTGVETRTSSPVKILRDANFQSNLQGLFPVGEGGGHAGGIVSSAVDGLKVAQSICNFLQGR